ncbi:UDP-N-acetylmuramoyl-L-alanyl-D-glutamate--2,6-diaminopimelate ligase [Chryseobacterium sp.]|uniref:UDP-N-acetylmuramoyl-L-alanyl-D-glutamate--2, 6-diaminopimelate ligase n=1 Tax=Chryseobacterium sp. TaxID=1871047 RepID=UPI0012A7D804|nr:UDP-N-acetylmuramoyl-L-alanyl-D-glutamate--2,6-diaminopimelate ligase [Chryseobacterium sp.]QFG54238.1 UDP-N-acetylmuramoyl-L-alanyl-D-glutamate--2,6-diaminopimelate ligase [Chryseobacterium sp.]
MNLKLLINRIPTLEISGEINREVSGVFSDSRLATEGSLYVALKGVSADGHLFIGAAIDNGAAVIVCQEFPEHTDPQVTYVRVKDTAVALGAIASNWYGNPSEKLKLVGITGTNGKTSVCTLLFDLFTKLDNKCALISTVEYRITDRVMPSTHTTPDVLTVNRILAEAVEEGCEFAFMEVSSHGIHQRRTDGLSFSVAGFTNITHDHLDYHNTFDEYLRTKKSFFDNLSPDATAITNLDDRNGRVMMQNTSAKQKTYAVKTIADYHGRMLEADFNGMMLHFNGKEFWTTLTGRFNVYNLLLAFAVAVELGCTEDEVLTAMSQLNRVNGRFEILKSGGGIFFVVDYAHTPDALENLLDSINEIRTKNERLITVFGCGGDRDREKRPLMGKLAARKSTLAILTSDNPRTENPEAIIREIEAGIEPQYYGKYTVIADRKEAIKMAIKFAEPKDIVLIAGKGHETYQEINGVRHHFDDREVIDQLWKQMSK